MLLVTGAEEMSEVKDNLGPWHKICCHLSYSEIKSNAWECFPLHLHFEKPHSLELKICNKNLHDILAFCSFMIFYTALDLVAPCIVVVRMLKYIAAHCEYG